MPPKLKVNLPPIGTCQKNKHKHLGAYYTPKPCRTEAKMDAFHQEEAEKKHAQKEKLQHAPDPGVGADYTPQKKGLVTKEGHGKQVSTGSGNSGKTNKAPVNPVAASSHTGRKSHALDNAGDFEVVKESKITCSVRTKASDEENRN
ncbi:hypothetical protein L208DRAFT_1376941 [Tricholoma matsutake]|nr:hypothetical protein L208DRAFT_1376941 [Tricholoma matsutake 945]